MIPSYDSIARGLDDIIIFDYYANASITKKLPNNNKILAMTKYDDHSFLYFDCQGSLYHYCINESTPQLITNFPIKNKKN